MKQSAKTKKFCLNDELLASYQQGLVSPREKKSIDEHLSSCRDCRQILETQRKIVADQSKEGLAQTPVYLIEQAKNLVDPKFGVNVIDILIKFSDQMFESLKTSAEILAGPQVATVGLLRSTHSRNSISKTVVVRKVFGHIRCDLELIKITPFLNKITVQAKHNRTGKMVENVRMTLHKDSTEIESHQVVDGQVSFDALSAGSYAIEIVQSHKPIGLISFQLIKI